MNHKILQSARRRNLNLSSVENELLKKKNSFAGLGQQHLPSGLVWNSLWGDCGHRYTSTGGLTQFSAAQTHLELRCCSLQERRPQLK